MYIPVLPCSSCMVQCKGAKYEAMCTLLITCFLWIKSSQIFENRDHEWKVGTGRNNFLRLLGMPVSWSQGFFSPIAVRPTTSFRDSINEFLALNLRYSSDSRRTKDSLVLLITAFCDWLSPPSKLHGQTFSPKPYLGQQATILGQLEFSLALNKTFGQPTHAAYVYKVSHLLELNLYFGQRTGNWDRKKFPSLKVSLHFKSSATY